MGLIELALDFWVFGLIIFISLAAILLEKKSKKRKALIDNYKFPQRITSQLAEKYPQLSANDISQSLEQLKEYFHLCRMAMAEGVFNGKRSMVAMPSKIVDEAWHEFILFTKEYENFCKKVFGEFLHHSPAKAIQRKSEVETSLQNAWRLACARQGINPLKPNRIPLLFSIDEICNVSEGNRYVIGDSASPLEFSVSRIKCNGQSSNAYGGGSAGGCGGGCGGDC